MPSSDLAPAIVFVDADLVVADKPAGLRSIPAGGEGRKDCLAARIRARHADARIVHRLDEATSGLVLFARSAEMLRRMNHSFRERMVGKEYQALVHGHVTDEAGEIDLPLAPEPDRNPYQRVDPVHGRRALTRYRVLERLEVAGAPVTRLALKPVTGRTHQLRVHLMSLGHPILGDPLYAPADSAARFGRLHLHAARLDIIHPRWRTPRRFEREVPF
ncbi:RluA family pseudouridine synthase [Nitrogeniibacter mangrovi]|uniref:Dual-specificity RNA pseudouridine synthase RluA n=1 Tax=Nitrogeniibacter mangrovi TaxID=2016596 RepID=A0A6C1BAP4_9RHOO|nr:RluA family pseudouridine synthase [Nitrogeniibacter mangrovi]